MKKLELKEMEVVEGGKGGFWSSCAGATIGLGFAFAGLTTLTAVSGGLATGITVGGWIVASAAWGATCG